MCLAVPGRIVTISGNDPLSRSGRIDFGGVFREVSLACVPEAREGDYVLVHVGLAISVMDADEAHELLDSLRQMAEAGGTEPPESSGEVR